MTKHLIIRREAVWYANIKINWLIINVLVSLLVANAACSPKRTGTELEQELLTSRAMVKDESMDSLLMASLPSLNCLATTSLGKEFKLAAQFNPDDTTQILVTPYAPLGKQYQSVAYADLINRQILLQPYQIRSFVNDNALNPNNSTADILHLVLLHELGHFKLKKAGAFDEPQEKQSKTGEQKLDTEPEYLTSIKRVELAADSVAISLCKQAMNSKKSDCFTTASGVLTTLPGMGFQLFGKRMLNDFGAVVLNAQGEFESRKPILRDPNASHPNLELRVIFMNYYMNPSLTNRQQVDEFLYNREVEPVIRQGYAPYIYQGQSKKLP